MDDETVKATKKFDAEESVVQKADDRASEELTIFNEQAEGLWGDVRGRLLKRMQDFNREEGAAIMDAPDSKQEDLIIRVRSPKRGDRQVAAHLDMPYHEIEYYAGSVQGEPDIQGKFLMRVTEKNALVLVDDSGKEQSPQYAANQMFDKALLVWRK